MRTLQALLIGQLILFLLGGLRAQCDFNITDGMVVNLGSPTNCCGGANFYDSGGPTGNYGNNESRTMKFVAPSGQRIQVNFTSFATENNYDWLWVYDGSGPNAPLIGVFSGGNLPPTFITYSDTLTFHFTSDATVTYSGWAASLQCAPTPTPQRYALGPGSPTFSLDCTAGLVFTDNGGTEAPYSPLIDDTVTFAPSQNTYAVLHFPYQLSLASGDSLWVWEGSPSPTTLLALFTQGNSRGERIVATQPGTPLIVRFKSDNANQAAGWQAFVYCASTPPASITWMGAGLRTLTCTQGRTLEFYDSGGPTGNYGNNESRTLRLVLPGGATACGGIQVSFNAFTTESCCDKLRIYNGGSTAASFWELSGSSPTPNPVIGTADTMLLVFLSDGITTYSGWQATIQCSQTVSVSVTPASVPPLCRGQSVTLTASGANSYTWNTGATGSTLVVSQPGTYYAIGTTASGCSGVSNAVEVSFHPSLDTTVQVTGSTLSAASPNPAYNYHWVSCANPSQSLGTGTSFTPTNTGWYAMVVHNPATGCRDTSNCHYVDISTSAPAALRGGTVGLYPNPSMGEVWVEAAQPIERLIVRDLAGRLVYETQPQSHRTQLKLTEAGLYSVEVHLKNGTRSAHHLQILH